MGKPSRDKGARFEREVVNAAKDMGLEARRTALSGMLAHEKGDVLITPGYVHDSDPWVFECKRRAKLPVLFNELADFNGLIVRGDNCEALAVIRLNDLLELLQ